MNLQYQNQQIVEKSQAYLEKVQENEELSNMVVDYEEKISKLIDDNEKLADLIVEKNEKLKEMQIFIEEKNVVEEKINDYELKLKELLESYDKLVLENESLKERSHGSSYYKGELEKSEKLCAEYQNELTDLKIKFEEYTGCIEQFEKVQERFTKDKEAKDLQITKMQVNLNGLCQENFLLKKEIEKRKASSSSPVKSDGDFKAERESLESQVKQLKEMNINSKAEMQNLYELLRVRKEDSEDKGNTIKRMQEQLSSLTKDLANSIGINEELQARLKRVSLEYEKINARSLLSKENSVSASFEKKETSFEGKSKVLQSPGQ